MVAQHSFHELRNLFPPLQDLVPSLADRLACEARPVAFPHGAELFAEGDRCAGLLATTAGTIRVSKTSEEGRELLLYDVRPGEMCVLTLTCLLSDGAYAAHGTTSGAVNGVLIPQPLFQDLVDRVPRFRAAVFSSLGEKIALLMRLVEEVAFRRLDQRLAAFLTRESEARRSVEIPLTHQEIAERLGTSREIVSRALGSFELQGIVQLGRKRIDLTDPAALLRIAGRDPA